MSADRLETARRRTAVSAVEATNAAMAVAKLRKSTRAGDVRRPRRGKSPRRAAAALGRGPCIAVTLASRIRRPRRWRPVVPTGRAPGTNRPGPVLFPRPIPRRPAPVAHLGHVLAVLADVRAVLDELVGHELPQVRKPRAELRHAFDDVLHEVEPVEVVAHHHVEGGGRRPLLFVAAHVDVLVVRAAVREP